VLTAAELRQAPRRRRSPYSDRQHYEEYVLQRVEAFKNSIGRDELLRLGDEAAAELQAASSGQFVLSEILMLDVVDRLIIKRLGLRSFARWRQDHLRRRAAQRAPVHWGLDGSCPLLPLLPRLEPDDVVLVFGAGAEATVYLLAAHDAAVTYVAADLRSVERAEARLIEEYLAARFDAYVVLPGPALPCVLDPLGPLDLVVIDPGALVELDPPERAAVVADLQARTAAGGVHVLLSSSPLLVPASLLPLYEGWQLDEHPRGRRRSGGARRPDGLTLCRPPCSADTT
jgi:hypothetical protein